MLDLREDRFEARTSGICAISAALIAGAATIGGAAISAVGASSAAHTQAAAANTAANTQLSMFNQTRQDLMPWMNTGQNALAQLASLWGVGPNGSGTPNAAAATQALTQFPGYQFGLNQGVTALDRSAASRGLLLSGAQLQDSQTFGQNYAMQQAWQPYISGLTGLSTMGQDSAAKVGSLGAGAASGAAADQLAAGQAGAAGQVGVANSLTGGIQNALLAYQLYGGGGAGGGFQPTASMFPTTTPNPGLDTAFDAASIAPLG